MLVVRVEIWPGGHREQAREIGLAGLVNVSDLARVSDYVCVAADRTGVLPSKLIERHERDAGFWLLLARAFSAEVRLTIPEALSPVERSAMELLEFNT